MRLSVFSIILITMVSQPLTAQEIVAEQKKLERFVPSEIWPDNNGVYINAHGGGILFHEGKYYWFGEHKTAGRRGNSTLNLFARCLGPQSYGSRCRRAEGIPRIESAHFAADTAVIRLAPRRLCLRGS